MTETQDRIAVITDTEGDIPAGFADGLPIYTLPLRVTDGVREFRDGVDITVDDVYRMQADCDFKTSLPGMDDIQAILDRIRADGCNKVIVLILSESLSSATNLFRLIGRELEDLEMAVLNTKSASVGVGILAVQTAKYIMEGHPFSSVKAMAERLIENTSVFFSLDTLEYLKRGGRIGRVTELVGSLLKIKPIITFGEVGTLSTAAKVHGSKAVPKHLLECIRQLAEKRPGVPYNLVICDGGVPEAGDALKADLLAALPDARLVMHGQVDATLAVHLGPHLLGAGIQFLEG